MTETMRIGPVRHWMYFAVPNKAELVANRRAAPLRRACRIISTGLVALLLASSPTLPQGAPLKVQVNAGTYIVNSTTVTGVTGSEPLDAVTIAKARFTARVLDEQILHSEFNKQIFDPIYRAVVFADQASGRLIEPWRRLLRNDSPAALADAKNHFKVWVTKLAIDPGELMLAVTREDYLEGIGAYRENAAIYRNVAKQKQTLTYDDALRLMRNAWPTIRLAYARGLEERLSGNSALASNAAGSAQAGVDRFSQRTQAEVINRVDNDVKSAADLNRIFANVRRIAEADSAEVRSYRDSISPPTAPFTAYDPKVGSVPFSAVSPGSITTKYTGQNTVTITTPGPAPKSPPLVNITGGILPSPYPIRNPSPAEGNAGRNMPATSPSGSPAGPSGSNFAGSSGSAPGDQSGPGSAGGDNTSASNAGNAAGSNQSAIASSAGDQSGINNTVNLETFSSKGYHTADGWFFNPATGLWQDPNDPAQTLNPAVIICCDDTGLAFPSDAVEAREDYSWDGGGTDPNCGRLYTCGPTGQGPGPDLDFAAGPTDKDDEILQALNFIDQNLPADKKGAAITLLLNSLPPQYQNRGIQLLRQYNTSHSTPSGGALSAGPPPISGYTARPGQFAGSSAGSRSTITGLGGVSSNYTPITPSAAQDIVGKYKSIPGGVTLEGSSPDLSFIKKVTYLARANAFILNDDIVYLSPVSPTEYTEIDRALAKDDKLGVSLVTVSTLIYGDLPPEGVVATNLRLADRFLSDIAFGVRQFTRGYVFAPNYEGKRPVQVNPNLAIFFNLHRFQFSQDAVGQLRRSNFSLDTTLVPLSTSKGQDGGHIPDFDRINRADVPAEYVANLKHLQSNVAYYVRERIVRIAAAYGEAAAFARVIKLNGIKPAVDAQ